MQISLILKLKCRIKGMETCEICKKCHFSRINAILMCSGERWSLNPYCRLMYWRCPSVNFCGFYSQLHPSQQTGYFGTTPKINELLLSLLPPYIYSFSQTKTPHNSARTSRLTTAPNLLSKIEIKMRKLTTLRSVRTWTNIRVAIRILLLTQDIH